MLETLLYFGPHFLVIIMLLLWSLDLWIFTRFAVNYPYILGLDAVNHLTPLRVLMCAGVMLVAAVVLAVAYYTIFSLGYVLWAAFLPMVVYPAMVVALLLCFDLFGDLVGRHCRIAFANDEVLFSDSLYADILTSLAKVFSDYTCSIFRMVRGEVAKRAWVDDNYMCGGFYFPVPFATAIPYIFRLVQCVRRWWFEDHGQTDFWNAVKYASSIIVIVFSALLHYFPERGWAMAMCIVFNVINSLHLIYWDVHEDWNIEARWRSQKHPNQHPIRKWVFYVWIVLFNGLLRLTWIYSIFPLRHNSFMVVGAAALEII